MRFSSRYYRALDMALTAHRHQQRGDFENYAVHVVEVANILAELSLDIPEDVIIAGLLHDTVEDGGLTYDDINDVFGEVVADAVMEVTDDPRLSRKEQKEEQIRSFPGKSYYGKLVKLADRLSNFAGSTGKVRGPAYHIHTKRLLEALEKWATETKYDGKLLTSHKYVFVLADKLVEAVKEYH